MRNRRNGAVTYDESREKGKYERGVVYLRNSSRAIHFMKYSIYLEDRVKFLTEHSILSKNPLASLIDSVLENMSVTKMCNVRDLKCFRELSLNAGVSRANEDLHHNRSVTWRKIVQHPVIMDLSSYFLRVEYTMNYSDCHRLSQSSWRYASGEWESAGIKDEGS